MQLRRIRPYGEMAVLAGVYLAVAWASLSLDFALNDVTAVWPPTGIALAALLLRGPELWPGVLVGSFLANWLTRVPALASAGVGVGDALECLAAVWLLRRAGFGNALDHSRDVGALLFAAIACAPLSATIGTASMLSGGAIAAVDAPSRWVTWCFGDAAGVILIAPALLTWFCRPRPPRGAAGPGERAALLGTFVPVVLLLFGKGFSFPYPVFPFLVWAGLRGGTRAAASASLFIAAASVFFSIHGRGLPGGGAMGGSIYHLLAFNALAGATALMLAAAVVEREAARGTEKNTLNLLRAFFSGLADRVFVKDVAGRYLMVNPVAAGALGVPADAVIGRTDLDLLAPDAWPAARAADRAVIATGQARTLEERFRGPAGEQVFLTTLGPFRDASGRPAGVVGISRDITERKHIEERLRESEEKFRSLVESATDYISSFDEDGRFLFLNRPAAGFDLAAMVGTTVYEYVDPEHHETIRRTLAEVFRTGVPGEYEIRGAGAGGASGTWYRCAVSPLKEAGRVKAVMVTAIDITARRNMEEKLRESEEQFRSLVENAPDFISKFGPDGRIWFLNRAAPGHDVSMFVGKSAYDFIGPADHERVARMLDQVFRTALPVTFETSWGLPGEPLRAFRCRVGPMKSGAGVVAALVVATDVTEAQKAEKELELSRERLQRLSGRLIEAQETERRHIARELHDEIGQALTAVKISLQAVESRAGTAAAVVSRLQESAAIVDEALDQVRTMSVALRPSLLDDLGLVPALRWYLEQQSARGGFQAHFEGDAEIAASPEVRTACFRIAQEALTNVARHAAARNVRLEIRRAGGDLRLTVSDDGKGFDVARVFARHGADASFGLHGMRERARLLGGRVTVESTPGAGAVVRAQFPGGAVE